MIVTLINFLIGLILLVLVLYIIRDFFPGNARLKNLVMLIAVAVFLLWLFGWL